MLDVSEIRTGFGKIRVLEWADGGGRNPRKDRECPKIEEGERFRRLGSVGPETGAGRAYLCFGRCEKCEFRTRNLLFCEKKFTFIVNLTG